MQSFQQRSGPIIHWTILFDESLPDGLEDAGAVELGLGLDEDADGLEFILRFTIGGEHVAATIGYASSSAAHIVSAAILALTRNVRIDVYVRERNRSIRHVQQLGLFLQEPLHGMVRSRAAALSRTFLADGEKEALERIALELDITDAEVALSGFGMLDSGKSEQVLEASLPATALGPFRTATAQQQEAIAAARRAALTAEAHRIEVGGDAAIRAAAEAATNYRKVVESVRPDGRLTPDYAAGLERVTAGAASATQAVVHLSIGDQGLEAFWADRADEDLAIARLALSEIDLGELRRAVSDPHAGSLGVLERPGAGGAMLGARLAHAAEQRGIQRLVLCPTRFLHQLPFHALPVGDSSRRLCDELAILYAPSSAVITMLQNTPARGGGALIAALELHHAEHEAIAVGALVDNPHLLTGAAATTNAFLAGLASAAQVHVCSHGLFVPSDYLASRLELAPEPGHSGHLTVARILAEADLAGIDLAVLGACLSGAGQTPSSALDVAGGIDSALLGAGVRNVASALWEIDDFGALLFHTQFYLTLSSGATLIAAHSAAVNLLRSGAWRDVRALPAGRLLFGLGIDLDQAFDQLTDDEADDSGRLIDFADAPHWSAYRLCGIGQLAEPARAITPRSAGANRTIER